MEKFIYQCIILIILIGLNSCTDPKNVKVDNKDASKYVNIIASELDSAAAEEFKSDYRMVLALAEYGSVGKMKIIFLYSKKYEDLTLRDLILKNSEN